MLDRSRNRGSLLGIAPWHCTQRERACQATDTMQRTCKSGCAIYCTAERRDERPLTLCPQYMVRFATVECYIDRGAMRGPPLASPLKMYVVLVPRGWVGLGWTRPLPFLAHMAFLVIRTLGFLFVWIPARSFLLLSSLVCFFSLACLFPLYPWSYSCLSGLTKHPISWQGMNY